MRVTGAPSSSQAWGWGTLASAWWPDLCPGSPAGHSPKRQQGTPFPWAHHLGRRQGPWRSDPRLHKLALGTWNVTSLVGKEPELVCEVEKFRLDIVGLTSTHNKGSGTSLLERGWTLYHSGVADGERQRAGVAILVAPRLSAGILEFTPGMRGMDEDRAESTVPSWVSLKSDHSKGHPLKFGIGPQGSPLK
ncbi:hypothetical protein D4764_04G0012120 [Takifugu flavidus]|uniref:Endonuclease/exonuclease/phosphatase domain-containing protein n=1 Tax=Takifugu flavidus TaxID=433684 RepID=A0A5C6N663_9TELE|nr:hypothetical protein D4764_04G0012120 [Takifugu flavidus]